MIYVSRTPFIPTRVPHLDTNYRKNPNAALRPILTEEQLTLLTPEFVPFAETNKEYDLVYIVKEAENNVDLKYSLRSVAKFCTFRKIWIVGYKPSWVKNVGYIKTLQKGNKWKNSMLNYEQACKCPDISDNFVLMNDDFFAIRQIVDWRQETNKCLGTIPEKIAALSSKKALSRWQSAFIYAREILQKLNCKSDYNYEAHIPMIINKQNFITMLNMPIMQDFQKTDKVLHKRSLYKNIFPDTTIPPKKIVDVKLELQKDLSSISLDENWVSVYDYVIDNCRRYPQINKLLRTLFADKCEFEV